MTPTKNESLPELPEPEELLHSPMHGHVYGYTEKQMRAYAEAALTREAPTEGVADGWKLVPVEPTREMVDAGVMFGNSPNKASIIYQNMIHSAPTATPPAPQRMAQGERSMYGQSDEYRRGYAQGVSDTTQPPHHDRGEVDSTIETLTRLRRRHVELHDMNQHTGPEGKLVLESFKNEAARLCFDYLPTIAAALTEAKQQREAAIEQGYLESLADDPQLDGWAPETKTTKPGRYAPWEVSALATFTEYFVKNYPGPETIIHDPKWHAPRIFRAANHAIAAAKKMGGGE